MTETVDTQIINVEERLIPFHENLDTIRSRTAQELHPLHPLHPLQA